MLTLVTWSTGRNDLAKKYLDWSCVFGWLSAKWWVFMRGNVCGGLSGNFVIRSASKQAPYALLIGSLHAKSPPAHNASNMFQPIITSGKEINILFRINSIIACCCEIREARAAFCVNIPTPLLLFGHPTPPTLPHASVSLRILSYLRGAFL